MNGKLVKTSIGCDGVSKERVVNIYKLVHRVVENKALTFRTLVLRQSNKSIVDGHVKKKSCPTNGENNVSNTSLLVKKNFTCDSGFIPDAAMYVSPMVLIFSIHWN